MRIQLWVGAILVVAFGTVMLAGSEDVAERSLPHNIRVPSSLRNLLQKMHDRSPTFRSQCDRIAAASGLQVELVIDLTIPRYYRAFTNLHREKGVLLAEIH